MAQAMTPEVVLMDIRMPGTDGLVATRALAGPDVADPVRVLVLTTFDLDDHVYDALRAGASGFLLKDAPRADLIAAVRTVAAGEALLAPSVTRRLIIEYARLDRERHDPLLAAGGRLAGAGEDLTVREVEVVRHLARGLSNAEIAGALVLSEHTVKTHVAHVLAKLGLRDRVQAVVWAYETGLVSRAARADPLPRDDP